MKRYIVLVAAVTVQVCIGGVLAWSVFVPPLRAGYGLTDGQAGLAFGINTAMFALGVLAAGRLMERITPRGVAVAGSAMLGAGLLLTAASAGAFPIILVGFGLVVGLGIGSTYVSAIAVCIRWFPRRKGLITAVAVMGCGGGAIVLSAIVELMLGRGMDVLAVFGWIGAAYGSVMLLGSLLLVAPPDGEVHRAAGPIRGRDLLRDRHYWSLAVGLFCGTFGGLMVIGNLKPMALAAGQTAAQAATVISVFAAGNILGRLFWGLVFERKGAAAIRLSLLGMAGSILLMLGGTTFPVFLVSTFLVGSAFGACFVVYAAEVASEYGERHVGSIYPMVFVAYTVSGLTGATVGGWAYDLWGTYVPAIVLASSLAVVGAVVSTVLGRRRGDAGAAAT